PSCPGRDWSGPTAGWWAARSSCSKWGPLGGFLFVLAACVPFFVNAGTYAASAVLVGLVGGTYRAQQSAQALSNQPSPQRAPATTPTQDPPRRGSVRRELAPGFSWLAGQRLLRTMALLIGLLNLTQAAATATWTIRI